MTLEFATKINQKYILVIKTTATHDKSVLQAMRIIFAGTQYSYNIFIHTAEIGQSKQEL